MAISDAIAAVSGIINKLIPDKAAAAAATAQLNELAMQGKLADELAQLQAVTVNQSDINKVEAASSSVFIAGWRPSVGWVCVIALGCNYVVQPFFTWGAALLSSHPVVFPSLDIASLMPLLFGLLGMGALRTVEKVKGVQGSH